MTESDELTPEDHPPEPSQEEINALGRDFETTKSLVLVTDAFGMFLKVSPSVKTLLGYERGDVEGRLALDFIYPHDLGETRNEMRLIRRTRRRRHFYSRYVNKANRPVELIWTGVWLEDREQFVFVGRPPRGREKLPIIHRLDVLDGFQMAKGMFAISLVGAWATNTGGNSTEEIRSIIEHFDGSQVVWIAFMSAYAIACMACLIWKQRWFQFWVSIVSVIMWIWMGFVTVLSPTYVAAAGFYELMLGVGSICVLYFRGRQLS